MLYESLLGSWNQRNARAFAGHFSADAVVIGFDGSQMNGSKEIENTIGQIFSDHQTAVYVPIVRYTRRLADGIYVLKADVGMVPRGQKDINPAVNAVQTITMVKEGDQWRIAMLQNTPAAFHGRPELSEKLSAELREEYRRRKA